MGRPRRAIPWLETRNGVWYVFQYDGKERRTRRRSCKTRDRSVAELRCHDMAGAPLAPSPRELSKRDPWLSMARRMCKRARENAKAKGRNYSLTPAGVLALLVKQNFRCAVTWLPLRLPVGKRDPWAPSLDQIRAGGGYAIENVRIVTTLVNTAMNQWGEGPLLEHFRAAKAA